MMGAKLGFVHLNVLPPVIKELRERAGIEKSGSDGWSWKGRGVLVM